MNSKTSGSRKPIRVSLIGCGRVAVHYLNIIQKYKLQEHIKISSIVDIDMKRAEYFGSIFQADTFNSVEHALASTNHDLAIVLTPSGDHFNTANRVLNCGVGVLVEKPGTLLIEDSLALWEKSKSMKLFLGCVHQNRFNRAVQAAKDFLQSGNIGRVFNFSVRLRWSRSADYYEDGWHGSWKADGGVISQQAFHHLDALRFLLGEVKEVSSFGATLKHPLEADDTSVAVLRLENGAVGTLEATTTIFNGDREASIEVFGEFGFLKIGGIALNQIIEVESSHCNASKLKELKGLSEFYPSSYGLSHNKVLKSVSDCLSNQKIAYAVAWEDSILTLRLIHAIYASQESYTAIHSQDQRISQRLGR